MINRNSRQCKDRWENYLSPKVDLSLWTKEEDNLLIAKRNEFGAHWVQIQHFFTKITDVALKNRWNFLQRENHKNVQQEHDQHVDLITSELSEPDSITNHTILYYDATSINASDIIFSDQEFDLIPTNQYDTFEDFSLPFATSSVDIYFE
jgi:hypothetical protein